METQTRPIPKKTYIIISILILLGIVFYFLTEYGKEQKAQRVLQETVHKNISNLSVATVHKYRNQDTNIEGFKYTVKFHDNDLDKDCRGFVWKDFKNNIMKDIECK